LKENLIQEHQTHLALYTQQVQECSEEEAFRTSEINNAQAALTVSQEHLSTAQSETTRASNLLDLSTAALAQYNNQIDILNQTRAATHAVYVGHSASLQNALSQISIALDYLNDFELAAEGVVPSSFVQVVNSLLALTVKTGHSHKVLPVYKKLLQAHAKQQLDLDDVTEVRELILTLQSNLEESQIDIDNNEDASVAAYNNQLAVLNGVVARLNNEINASNAYLANLADIITQETSISTMAQGKITRNQDLLTQAQTTCADNAAEFQSAETARANQIELIGQLESAVKTLESEYDQELLPEISDIISVSGPASATTSN
jgi:chromosome segregation ATPase